MANRQRVRPVSKKKAAAKAAARAAPPAARPSGPQVLRTVEDFEGWLAQICAEDVRSMTGATDLRSKARTILQLLKESRRAPKPTLFKHRGQNPLVDGKTFEQILLQSSADLFGPLAITLYAGSCNAQARELIVECTPFSNGDAGVHGLDAALKSFATSSRTADADLDTELSEMLAACVQNLQELPGRKRKEKALSNTRALSEGKREEIKSFDIDGTEEGSQRTDAIADAVLEMASLLEQQKNTLLPMHDGLDHVFVCAPTCFDELTARPAPLPRPILPSFLVLAGACLGVCGLEYGC